MNNKLIANKDGVALLLSIWVLAMLIGVATAFSYTSRLEVQSGYNIKMAAKARYLAEAGINMAILQILNKKNTVTADAATNQVESEEDWLFNGEFNELNFDDGQFIVKVVPENSRVDLNFADEVILDRLLDAIGVPEGADRSTIVDSIMDWKDEDNLHKLNGAEEDYYMSLPTPYKPADSYFTSIEELLLVKGVTQEIFYGTGEKKGLKDLVTVYSSSFVIDFNSAPKEVLMAIPGIEEEDADKILEFRKTNEIQNVNDVQLLIPAHFMAIRRYVGTGIKAATVFSIESIGRVKDFKTEVGIRAAVEITNEYSFLFYKTPEVIKYNDMKEEYE
ncbi:MAG: general secretion pathway protein GspK [Candidatus Magnetoovum sp. WYHC-5]|nr:general secretion pathway protein GspK [Candidatus Magnetoovum sp. WYHC-5]